MENPHIGRTRSSWPDLPQDIQGLILGKLNPVDIIRFRAVYKNGQISRDRIIKSKHHLNLPWLCKLCKLRLQREIYDPHSRQIFNTRYTKRPAFDKIKIRDYGSKDGWLIAGIGYSKSMFMYNPYSMEFISLPPLPEHTPLLATFSGIPVSLYCQVFIHCKDFVTDNSYIYSYRLNGHNLWRHGAIFVGYRNRLCGLECMNGQIFCLFSDGITERYSVVDKSWTLVNRIELNHKSIAIDIDSRLLWLTKGKGDILMAVVYVHAQGKCLIAFSLDWSDSIWVQSDISESTAFFISFTGILTSFERPFANCHDRDTMAHCNVHFFDKFDSSCYGTKDPSYYSHGNTEKFW